jgi:hypothetical protein
VVSRRVRLSLAIARPTHPSARAHSSPASRKLRGGGPMRRPNTGAVARTRIDRCDAWPGWPRLPYGPGRPGRRSIVRELPNCGDQITW